MEPEKLKEKVEAAKQAVEGLEEPLKSKAFEIILNKLLYENRFFSSGSSQTQLEMSPNDTITFDEDVGDKLVNMIDSTSYPLMYKMGKTLDRALYCLFIAKKDHGIDGLTPTQISKVLSAKFRLPTTSPAIGMALMKAGNLVDRTTINTSGGLGYEYKIMYAGEQYLKDFEKSPHEKVVVVPTRKRSSKATSPSSQPKKPKSGLKERILELLNESYFEQPKEVNEIKEELGNRGFHYNKNPIMVTLLRLVKKRVLRRIKDIKDGQNIYKYCNT